MSGDAGDNNARRYATARALHDAIEVRAPVAAGVNGYGQHCPMTRAVQALVERWSFLIVRDLLCGATRFNDIARGYPKLSCTMLSKRRRQLEWRRARECRGGCRQMIAVGLTGEPVPPTIRSGATMSMKSGCE